MSCSLIEASYGKSRVRLTKVSRLPDRHELKELAVDIQLQGEFDDSYLTGDNKMIVATDTMKNSIYVLAANHAIEAIEDFAKHVGDHFLSRNKHVHVASVSIQQDLWARAQTKAGMSHTFIGGNREKRVTSVDSMRGCISVESGIEDLVVLKTTDSEFWGFMRDEYTTLPEVHDRIFATTIMAHWLYKSSEASFNANYEKLRQLFIEIFAEHHSLSVQQTLYAMGTAALEACSEIDEIRIAMPNQHRLPFDLTRFGLENRNEIFVPTDEPYGLISATVSRSIRPCMEPAATAGSIAIK